MMKVKLVNILLLLIIIIGINSCVNDDYSNCKVKEPLPIPQWSDDVYLNLSLEVLSNAGNVSTRANSTDDDNYFENPISQYEKIHTIRVIIVRGSRTTPIEYVTDSTGYIEHNHLFTLDNLGVIKYDDMIFKVKSGEKKIIYFIVNEAIVKEQNHTDFDELKVGTIYPASVLENMTLRRGADEPLLNNDKAESCYYIPMSEKFEIDVPLPENPGQYTLDKHFFVTRAAVKFSFNVNFAQTDFPNSNLYVKDITINGFAREEYLLPRDTKYSDMITDSHNPPNILEGMFVEEYTIPEANTQTPYLFETEIGYVDAIQSYSPALYFPESKPNTDYSVGITLADREAPEQDIVLGPVILPNLPSLPRNTHVLVNLNVSPHSLSATATVFPYTGVYLNPSFGFGVPVQEVHITTDGEIRPEVAEGQTISLIGYVTPDDANNKDITWSSEDETIATVSQDGTVTGVKEGTVDIIVTSVDDPTKTATLTITVNQKKSVEKIELKTTEWTGNVEETITLEASITPADATNKNIIWTTEDKNIATVSTYGTVTAVNPGTTTITATSADNKDAKATCTIHVNNRVQITGISLSPTSLSIVEGGQSTLSATIIPQNATNQDLKWTSSDPKIATVSSYGLVTAIKAGSVTIKAEAQDGSGRVAERTVTVTAKTAVTSVSVNPTTLTLRETQSRNLTYSISPGNATYQNVVWTSDNPYVASASGRTVTAMNEGTANITVTSVDNPNASATCVVTVLPKIPVTGITIKRRGGTVISCTISTSDPDAYDIRAVITPADATNKKVVCTSSNENVATITFGRTDSSTTAENDGTEIYNIKAVGKGTATITITSVDNPEVKTYFYVTVTN